MKNSIIISILFFGFIFHSFSQVEGGKNEKLSKLFNQQKYEDCLYKAIDMTYNEKTKKDPEPYLYAAICNYEISLIDEEWVKEDYPKAFKDAMKYLIKFKKKDKNKILFNQNTNIINTIKNKYIDEAVEYFNSNNYKKASYNFGQIANLEDNNYNYLFIKGVCDAINNNLGGVQKNHSKAMPKINSAIANKDYKVDKKIRNIVIKSFELYGDHLVANDEPDSARSTFTIAIELFPNMPSFKVKLDSIPEVKKTQKRRYYH
ncbi:MAG: hypothetical protein KAT68_00935 [Bacteroidales bacterium]|nr:hypothetical protein [Bacteroidales bacterium]